MSAHNPETRQLQEILNRQARNTAATPEVFENTSPRARLLALTGFLLGLGVLIALILI